MAEHDVPLAAVPEPEPDLPGSSQALLDAVTALSSDLDLHSLLSRIVESACALTGARYGALGVLAADESLADFVTWGITPEQHRRIGALPAGHGILGLLIRDPRPLRLHDLRRHPASTGFPADHPAMTSFLGVPVHIRGTVFGNLYLTEKQDGRDFTDTDEQLVVALAQAAGLVIENARAYSLSERRRQWLEAAATLTDVLQPPVDLDFALQLITATARRVGRAWATVLLSDKGVPRAVVCEPADADRARDAVARVQRAVVLERLPEPADVDLTDLVATVVPLGVRLADAGTLVALFTREQMRARDVDDREQLITFADHAALALDRAHAVADREVHAVTADRERIARDLHDVVIQRLFATGMQLRAASMRDGTSLAAQVEQAVEELDGTIRDVRAAIFELQNDGSGSLRNDLRALAREYAEVLGFAPTVRTSGPVDSAIGEALRDQLLPVAREALSNVARHAAATRVEVELVVDERDVVLVIADNGVGMSPERVHSGLHSGLRNARERARAWGGDLDLLPQEPHGLLLHWHVPLVPRGR